MKSKRFISCALSLFLVIAILFATVSAMALTPEESYNYSRPGSEYNKTLTSADILSSYLDTELSTVESDYLISCGEVKIEYNDAITTAYVTTSANGDTLTVSALPYSYTASSGATVTWTPVVATLLGEELPLVLADTDYEATFDVLNAASLSDVVTVRYTVSFDISSTDINSLINKAYTDAPRLKSEIEAAKLEYQARYEEYLQNKAAYDEYLDYSEKLAAYEEYLVKYNSYCEALDKYNAYLNALESYESALSAYEAYRSDMDEYYEKYTKYHTYLTEKQLYDEKMEEYEEYCSRVAEYRYHLSIMSFLEKEMTPLRRPVYKAIKGPAVATVLEQRDLLESEVGGAVPSAVIDLAEDSTERLKELLVPYFGLTGEEERYYYYSSYYEDIKNAFCDLFRSLDYLYANYTVRSNINLTGKGEEFRILLAQLFVVTNALTDGPVMSIAPSYLAGHSDAKTYKQFVYDGSYRIDVVNEFTVDQVLYYESYIEDTDSARPFKESFPDHVEEPTLPTEVTEPTKPNEVTKPVRPDEETEPQEPVKVENPGNAPARVEDPGDPPEPYTVSPEVEALILAFEENELTLRNTEASQDFTYTVTKAVDKKIGPNVEEITVSFYDTDGTLLFSTTVDQGTPVSYEGSHLPTKSEDARARYVFAGWQTAEGMPVSLTSINSDTDLSLYPRFEELIKEYQVSWSIDGSVFTDSLPYGVTPECNYDTQKPDDSLYYYTFQGFDKEILPVTEDVCYTAQFASRYIVPTSEGGGSVALDAGGYTVDLRESYDTEYRIDRILEKSAGRYSVTLNTRYAKIVLSHDNVSKMIDEDVSFLEFRISRAESGSYLYLVTTKNSSEYNVNSAARVEVFVPCGFVNNDRLGLYYNEGNNEHKATFTLSDSILFAKLVPGRAYELRYEYRLALFASGPATAQLEKNVYNYGESIKLTLDTPMGVRIRSAVLKLDGGEEIDVTLSELTMPMSDAKLVIEAEYIQYKVVFSDGENEIKALYCKYGDVPTPPVSPPKAPDGEYTYEFIGWSAEIVPVTCDTVYYARYSRTPVVKADTGGRITLFMLLNLAATLAFTGFFLVIPSTVVNVKVLKKLKAQIVKNTEKTV